MPAIKITLSRLIELFGKSTSDIEALQLPSVSLTDSATALPKLTGGLAARLMTLAAHVIRVEQKGDAQMKELAARVSALTDILQSLAQPEQGTAPAAAQVVPSTPPGAAPAAAQIAPVAEEEAPTADDDFEARLLAESAAEVAAINAAQQAAEVTPLPRKVAK